MSNRLFFIILTILIIMLSITFRFIKSQEPNFNRRETLEKTLKNAEKLAKTRERAKFLVNCRHKNVTPNFLKRKLRTMSDIFPNSRQVENIQKNYLRKLLNEAIRCTFRTEAFLKREERRLALSRRVEKHPLCGISSVCGTKSDRHLL